MTWPAEFITYERIASVGQVGGFRPPGSARTSWAGQVLVGAAGEQWPESNGRPMWGVCQINTAELVSVPPALEGVALVTLFVDLLDLPIDTPSGQRWELRTYSSVDELVPLLEPERAPVPERLAHEDIRLRPFPVRWHPRVEIPSRDDAPDALLDHYDDAIRRDGLKVGGWPDTIQSEVVWYLPDGSRVDDAEFVLQVDSDKKMELHIVDAGAIYIAHSQAT